MRTQSLLAHFAIAFTVTESRGIGRYVAAGIGLSDTAAQSQSPNLSLTPAAYGTGIWKNSTTDGGRPPGATTVSRSAGLTSATSASNPKTAAEAISGLVTQSESSTRFVATARNTSSTYNTSMVESAPTGHASGGRIVNQSMALSGDCWQQWIEYWSTGPSTVREYSGVFYTDTLTVTEPVSVGTSLIATLVPATTLSETFTYFAYAGLFTEGTYTTTRALTYEAYTSWSARTLAEGSYTTTETTTQAVQVLTTTVINNEYPIPNCTLPSDQVSSRCQASWTSYITNLDVTRSANNMYESFLTPKCAQASITGAPCDRLITDYLYAAQLWGDEDDGAIRGGYSSTSGSLYWPSTMQVAPGCTLGCQTCAITGETVQLYVNAQLWGGSRYAYYLH